MQSYIFKLPLVLLVLVLASKVNGKAHKIVGGRNTYIDYAPYQVSLQYDGEHICGGSIIAQKFILTAAHCVRSGLASDYSVRAGSTYHARGGVVVRVFKVMTHPHYSTITGNYDVAVLELEQRLTFSEKIQAIPLCEEEITPGEYVTLTGWGLLYENSKSDSHPHLQYVMLPVVSREKCKKSYIGLKTVTPIMFCAGYTSGGRDTCQGDSGGPAVADGKQVGIVSFGKGCGRPDIPGVYTNVAAVLQWIKSKMVESNRWYSLFINK